MMVINDVFYDSGTQEMNSFPEYNIIIAMIYIILYTRQAGIHY